MKNIIGKTYFVHDGSYSTCLNNKNTILTACQANDYELIPTKILSKPFSLVVKDREDKTPLEFILIGDNKENVYSVMFKDTGIVTEEKTLADFEIDANKKRQWDKRFALYGGLY